MRWKEYLQKKFVLPIILWFLFSLRIFPSNLTKTLVESGKMFIGSGLYGFGMAIMANALTAKLTKKHFSREYLIKLALWLAVITAISASLDHYFRLHR